MAESKGALIAKTVQKHAGRAKEKVFMVLLFESCEEFHGVGVKTIAVCVVKVACGVQSTSGINVPEMLRRVA
ncbi:hypothetical protein RR46_06495 [Papilio xuthus]|uniref:Uncharacterized protein n=1 Tax=Papilio xuthus TaxID=66420 RepID=A0A194QD42_PAPXU|nr:hypothetical protein RR46_06495 [Papilio xuthus]